MALRVNSAEVKEIFETNLTDLTPFITVANLLVEQHLSSAGMTAAYLKEIEKWLAAHFAAIRDPRLSSRTIGDASETYHKPQLSEGLSGTVYGQQVLTLDYSGKLAAGMKGSRGMTLEAQ